MKIDYNQVVAYKVPRSKGTYTTYNQEYSALGYYLGGDTVQEWEYYETGEVKSTTVYGIEGSGQIKYECDKFNRHIGTIVNGDRICKKEYDEYGNVIWRKWGDNETTYVYGGEDHRKLHMTNFWDADKKHREVKYFHSDRTEYYTYDEDGNIIRHETISNTKIRYPHEV